MANSAIVWSPDGVIDDLDEAGFIEAIKRQWPSAKIIPARPDLGLALTAQVSDEDPRGWQIFYLGEGQLSAEGSQEDHLRFGAWAARLLAADDPRRLVLLDSGCSVAAYLRPGMTPEQILAAWNEDPPF